MKLKSKDKKLSRSLKDRELTLTPTQGASSKMSRPHFEKEPSPMRYKEESKHSSSKDKFKRNMGRLITDHHEMFGSSSRKVTTTTRTPKNMNTWLVRQSRQTALQKAYKSRSRLESHPLQLTVSPKAYENALLNAQRSILTSKAVGKYVRGFPRNNNAQPDLKQIVEQKNRSYIRQTLHSRNDNTKSPVRQTEESSETPALSRSNIPTQKIREEEIFIPIYNCVDDLTEEEYKTFGDRFPSNFTKLGFLGRGGFSLVWLGQQKKSKKKLAIKQILTKNPHQTHLKEIWFGNYFFGTGGEPRQEFQRHPGINNICSLLAYDIKPVDTWLFYELCQDSLASCLYELKGYTVHDQRLYTIMYKPLYNRMIEQPAELRHLIVEVCKPLMLLNAHNIVHSDLKTENILLRLNRKEQRHKTIHMIKELKIIDFGSSFLMTNLKQFSMATPQYMPPEILNYILYQNGLDYDEQLLKKIKKYTHPWVIDIWSLGCIVLEIVHGVPLWMSLKTKIDNTSKYAEGLFAVKGRKFEEIIRKQIDVAKKLQLIINEQNHSGLVLPNDIKIVLKQMLELDPEKRISPREAMSYFGIEFEPDRFPFY